MRVTPKTTRTTRTGEAVSSPKTRRKAPVESVALVAAGPGDPDLMTLRAIGFLEDAEVVIADADAVGVAQHFMAPSADLVTAVDKAGMPLAVADRVKLAVDAAKDGRRVVRVVAGDRLRDASPHVGGRHHGRCSGGRRPGGFATAAAARQHGGHGGHRDGGPQPGRPMNAQPTTLREENENRFQ